jgi:site-specific recombinase XerC
MPRGRPRKYNPRIPAHIDQAKIPAGIYWDTSGSGRWYTIERAADGKPKAKTIAGPKAYLSDLYRIAEQQKGVAVGTVKAVLDYFHESVDFRALAKRTREDYDRYRAILIALPTKLGTRFGELAVARLTPPVIQRLVESIAQQGRPTKANHLLRYLRRTLRWGVNHGHCPHNPAAGVQQVKEARNVTVPALDGYTRVLQFATERAARQARTRGSCAPYLPLVMELAYLCRLRGIEVLDLTDASVTPEGLLNKRRKGSNDTIVAWSPRLRAVVDAAIALRKRMNTTKDGREKRPTPLRPELRPLIVAEDGERLSKSGLDTAWQRLMRLATDPKEGGVIAKEERFGLHAMKHRGITDTAGTRADKQLAGGHKSEAMTQLYDHEVPVVPTPKKGDFSGEF